ncbi:MAG: hypothetical protein QXX09_04070 [Candidatus Methanomethylicia archaeon]
MVSEIKAFQTLRELMEYINERIKEIEELIRKHQEKLEDIGRKIETYKRIAETFISSKGSNITGGQQEIDFYGIGILINPKPEREIEILEEVLRRVNDRLVGLYKVRKALELLNIDLSAKINCQVVIIDDIPQKLIIKF